jgi:hypothetical protein
MHLDFKELNIYGIAKDFYHRQMLFSSEAIELRSKLNLKGVPDHYDQRISLLDLGCSSGKGLRKYFMDEKLHLDELEKTALITVDGKGQKVEALPPGCVIPIFGEGGHTVAFLVRSLDDKRPYSFIGSKTYPTLTPAAVKPAMVVEGLIDPKDTVLKGCLQSRVQGLSKIYSLVDLAHIVDAPLLLDKVASSLGLKEDLIASEYNKHLELIRGGGKYQPSLDESFLGFLAVDVDHRAEARRWQFPETMFTTTGRAGWLFYQFICNEAGNLVMPNNGLVITPKGENISMFGGGRRERIFDAFMAYCTQAKEAISEDSVSGFFGKIFDAANKNYRHSTHMRLKHLETLIREAQKNDPHAFNRYLDEYERLSKS